MGRSWKKKIIEKKKINKNFTRHKERLLKDEVEELEANHKFITGELNPQAPGKRNRKRKRAKEIKKGNTEKKPVTFGPFLPPQILEKQLTLEDDTGDTPNPIKKRRVNQRIKENGQEENLTEINGEMSTISDISKEEPKKMSTTSVISKVGPKRMSTKSVISKESKGISNTSVISKESKGISNTSVISKESKGMSNTSVISKDSIVGMENSNMNKPKVGPSNPNKELFSVKKHWLIHQDYNWAKNKLNSICKDLQVKHIVDTLTVQVYETYAKIALEMKDLPALNECLLKLLSLYKIGLEGNKFEFISYAILHELVEKGEIFYGSPLLEEKGNEYIDHAKQVVYAVESGQYKKFFSLYLISPNMSDFLLDLLFGRVRKTAIKVLISKHQKPINLSVVVSELFFQNKEECMIFLETTKYKYDHTYLYTSKEE